MKRVLFGVFATAIALAGMMISPTPASASCGYSDPVSLQSAFTSQTYAGVQTTERIPYIYQYSDAGCLQGFIFTFVGGGGADIQVVKGSYSNATTSGEVTATWTPQALEYKLFVDVVYQYGIYSTQTTARWTYEGPLGGAAFKPLPAPSSPVNPGIDTNDRTLSIHWESPSTNSYAVSKYKVRRVSGEPVCEVGPEVKVCTLGDQPDGKHAFIVSAVNTIGAGSEAQTPTVTVGPPQAPSFSSIQRSSNGQSLVLRWPTSTGTTALARVFRIYDQANKEVCGLPVTIAELARNSMACAVRPAKSGSQYKLKVETSLGVAESAMSSTFKPIKPKKR